MHRCFLRKQKSPRVVGVKIPSKKFHSTIIICIVVMLITCNQTIQTFIELITSPIIKIFLNRNAYNFSHRFQDLPIICMKKIVQQRDLHLPTFA